MRKFPIECDQQTIEQAVLDCIAVNKLLSDLHNQQRSEYGTRRIGRALTDCRNIEIFLRKIMERVRDKKCKHYVKRRKHYVKRPCFVVGRKITSKRVL